MATPRSCLNVFSLSLLHGVGTLSKIVSFQKVESL